MGMIKHYSIDQIISGIHSARWQCSDPRMDGYTTWGIKQDLYQIKWIVDESLKRCPTYAGEEQWLKEQEQKRLIKMLSEE